MVYATDLRKDMRSDDFMGKGFEEALEMMEAKGFNFEIGTYFNVKDWVEEAKKQIGED